MRFLPFKKVAKRIERYRGRRRGLKNLKKNFKQDLEKYIKYSQFYSKQKDKRHFQADLIFNYHKIEKGLSMPNPRVGFGEASVNHLIVLLKEYIKKFGWDDISLVTLKTIENYHLFNKKNNYKMDGLEENLNVLHQSIPNNYVTKDGGAIEVTKEELDKSDFDFKDFAYARYSIRNFAEGEVNLNLIQEAVKIAQKTPSVCNRQTAKVYVYDRKENISKLLRYQNGNRGFGHLANKILIVTSDLRDFRGTIERNQCYIDGGMFSMSLIYALHSLGVGTCPLNLSVTNDTENKLKQVAKIGKSEVLIMMIAVGRIPDKLMVAASPRKKLEDVLIVYE